MKTILLMLLSFANISALANEPKVQLVVWAKDGSHVAYALAEEPKVTFTDTDFVISTNSVKVSYLLKNMARFTYETNESAAVKDIKTDEKSFVLDGELLLFPALSANSTIQIYTLKGNLVFKKTVLSAGAYSFPLIYLNAGVYMVKVNGISYKIVKK